ncbi:hypothetical protein AAFC00_005405 [Neodothiora populina]|uniref:Uncharacterized protein n=1 Tax=Neodothiora populina TaxID=2781224 RepID=A0ABR3PL16_9PEZI
MSHEALPIDAPAFARAIQDLPVDALHSNAAELTNNIRHLKSSNEQMMPFADEGDQDCKDAMFENLIVIGRINERIDLLRAEVERRGMRWADAEVEESSANASAGERLVNGTGTSSTTTTTTAAATTRDATNTSSGSLTDAELMARLQERMNEDEDGEEGVHL